MHILYNFRKILEKEQEQFSEKLFPIASLFSAEESFEEKSDYLPKFAKLRLKFITTGEMKEDKKKKKKKFKCIIENFLFVYAKQQEMSCLGVKLVSDQNNGIELIVHLLWQPSEAEYIVDEIQVNFLRWQLLTEV